MSSLVASPGTLSFLVAERIIKRGSCQASRPWAQRGEAKTRARRLRGAASPAEVVCTRFPQPLLQEREDNKLG